MRINLLAFLSSLAILSSSSSSFISADDATSTSTSTDASASTPPTFFHMPIQVTHHSTISNLTVTGYNRAIVGVLTGCPSLVFSTSVKVGGQGPFDLIVDSGSSTMSVASAACGNCGVTPEYDPTTSSGDGSGNTGGQVVGSGLKALYGDGSGWTGRAITDYVSVGNSPPVKMNFATIDSQQNNFFSTKDCLGNPSNTHQEGILGMAFSSLTLPKTDSFMQQLVSQTGVPNQWAIQLCGGGNDAGGSTNAGNVWLGGYDPSFTSNPNNRADPFQYVPIAKQQYYNVFMTDVQLGGSSLGFGNSLYGGTSDGTNTIVDTGTTQIILPQSAFDAFTQRIQANALFSQSFGANFFTRGYCTTTQASIDQLNAQLPKMTIVLAGDKNGGNAVPFELPATESYLWVRVQNDMNLFCPGLSPTPNGQHSILGYPFLQSFTTLFDNANNRIGFAPTAKCGQTAPSFQWIATSQWGACSASCGSGTQTRTVACVDASGATVSNEQCAAVGAMLATSQPCNTQDCAAAASTPTAQQPAVAADSVNIDPTTLSPGTLASVTYALTSSSSSTIVALFLQSSSSAFPYYISRTASGGQYKWTVPATIPSGTYTVAASATGKAQPVTGPSVTVNNGGDVTANGCGLTTPLSSQCAGHGVCRADGSQTCDCSGGFTGSSCTTAPSSCTLQCANSGTLDASKCSCTCPAQFAGPYCQYRYADATLTLAALPAAASSAASDTNLANDPAFVSTLASDVTALTGDGTQRVEVAKVSGTDPMSVDVRIMTLANTATLNSYLAQLQHQIEQKQMGNDSPILKGQLSTYFTKLQSTSLPPADPTSSGGSGTNSDDSGDDSSGGFASNLALNVGLLAGVVGGALLLLVLALLYCCCCLRRPASAENHPYTRRSSNSLAGAPGTGVASGLPPTNNGYPGWNRV